MLQDLDAPYVPRKSAGTKAPRSAIGKVTTRKAAKMADVPPNKVSLGDTISSTMEQYCKEIMELRINIRDLEFDKGNLQKENEKLKLENDALKIDNTDLRTNLELHDKRAHITDLNATIRKLNEQVELAQKENDELKARIAEEEMAMRMLVFT